MTLDELAKEINRTARDHGWWEEDRNFGEMLALMHSEISEALEAHREGKPAYYTENGKPEGWATELVDCIIRILDTIYSAQVMVGIDYIMREKLNYNKTRPYKHGGKLY